MECSGKETNSVFGTSLLSAGILVHLFKSFCSKVEKSVQTELIAIINFNLVLTESQQIREFVSANEQLNRQLSLEGRLAHTSRNFLMAESSRRVKLILICFESSKQLKFEQIRDNRDNGFEKSQFSPSYEHVKRRQWLGTHQNS